MENPRVSLHILTRDRLNALAVLLSSMISQTYKNFDIVILDTSTGMKLNEHSLCLSILKRLELEGHRIQIETEEDTIRDIGRLRNRIIELDKFNNPLGLRIDDDTWCETDYIELLVKGFDQDVRDDSCGVCDITGEKHIGIVGGIVPYIFYPKQYRIPPQKFNEISEFYDWNDDCVNFYNVPKDQYFESGHIRSSYMYRIDLAKEIKFPEYTGPSGFTEETYFCIKVWMSGYKILINPNAVNWHIASNYGGGRDKIKSQEQMNDIKKENLSRLKKELDEFRKSKNTEARSYP